MGYYTSYNLYVCGADAQETRKIYEEIAEAAGESTEDVEFYGFTGKWYDYGEDLAKIAAKHPNAIIEVIGHGDPGDIWKARYRGDQVETIRYEGLPPFCEILTPEEESEAFNSAYRAFIDAKNTMVRCAATHIRRVKARITGREDCHLYLKAVPSLCTVEGRTPITDTPYRTGVTGISDDGESVTTDDDPMDLADLSPESVHNVVRMVDSLEKDLKSGLYKGRYDEDDGWFIVEPVE